MKLDDIEVLAQDLAVLNHVNEKFGTTFELIQMRGADFEHMRLKNAKGTVLIASLETIDKVCVGLLAAANEVKE